MSALPSRMRIASVGHARMQFMQPVHLSVSTSME